MAMSDLLYPGNPERREKLIRKSQELFELMRNNFEATNKLTEMVNEQLRSSFSPITLNEKASLQENCEVMTERVKQIQAKVNEADEELKRKLSPKMYGSLQHVTFETLDELSDDLTNAIASVCQLSTFVLIRQVKSWSIILTGFISTCLLLSAGLCAAIVFGVAVDLIVSAIVGGVERSKLETALKEYDEALEKFRPASKDYQEAVNEVRFMLKFMKKRF